MAAGTISNPSLASRAGEMPERAAAAGVSRLAYAVFVVLLLAFGAIAVQTYSLVKRELTDVIMARREAVAQFAAATLSERLDRMVDLAVSLGTRVRFTELVAAGQWNSAVQILRSVPSDFPFVDRVVLYDVRGTVMADVPELAGAKGENRADRDWYQGVSRGWKPYVSEVYRRGAVPQRHVFAVVVPIVDRNTAPAGVLQLQIHLEAFFDWAKAISVGAGASTYVVDHKGTAAFHSSIPVEEQLVNLSTSPAVARLLQGKSGVELVADAAGTEQIYAYMPSRHGWGVVVQQPAIAAFAARDDQLRRLLVGYGVILLFCAATVVLTINLVWQHRRAREGERAKVELERRVAERTEELEIAIKELESFSYSVSHDLRTPLRAIDGFSRIVQEDYAGKLDVEGLRLLGVIRDNSQKMAQLIDDLLEYSRLGRKSLSTGAIDMKRLVEEVLGELQASGERSPGLVLAALPPARGDATLVKQAWTNLLANAIKFSGKREQPVIEVSGHENGAESVYCVKDNGAGFDMQYSEKLFGVFQRLHGNDEFPGVGVGLAIVRRIVSRHGGRVWAEGKVDEGAAFYFSLPRGRQDG